MILPLSFSEEAKKVWEKREEEWEREKKARDRLMSEVMTFFDEVSLLVRQSHHSSCNPHPPEGYSLQYPAQSFSACPIHFLGTV